MLEGRPIRVYTDTSVFGGVYDVEFENASKSFFNQARNGRFQLVVSPIVASEITPAPVQVQDLYDQMLKQAELIDVSSEALQLQQAYLNAGIVGVKIRSDALHVALATVSLCPIIVSWNFKHIVHFEKIPLYNAVNRVNGYHEIAIHTPQEVIVYDEKDL